MSKRTGETSSNAGTGTRGTYENYERVLDEFGAVKRPNRESVHHLMDRGFSSGQARSAVHRYRERHGLLDKRPRQQKPPEVPAP
jgi:uncharacterized protein YoaH (UPF0181 family)